MVNCGRSCLPMNDHGRSGSVIATVGAWWEPPNARKLSAQNQETIKHAS